MPDWLFWVSVPALAILLFHCHGLAADAPAGTRSVFVWIARQWVDRSGDFSHGWLMPIIALGFVWWDRKKLLSVSVTSSRWGLGLLVVSLALHWAAVRAEQPRISLVAFVGVIWAIPLYVFGARVAKILMFPCSYLLLCFSSYFLVNVTFPLRLFASTTSAWILRGIGIAAQNRGTAVLCSPGLQLDVADPCSGLRSLLVISALAAPLAHLTQRTVPRKWLFFALSIPIAAFANILRVVTIALVARGFGMDAAMKVYHDYSGYLVFVAAVLLLLAAGQMLHPRTRPKKET